MVRREDVGDRFVGEGCLDPVDYGLAASLVQRRFHHHNAIRLLDNHRVVGHAGQVENAGRDLRRVDLGLGAVFDKAVGGKGLVERA